MNKTKIIKFIIAIIVAMVQLCAITSKVNAANIGETKTLERGQKGYYCVQKWDGSKWVYLTYNQTFYTDNDGQKYIAYCLSPGKPGVGYVSDEKESYDVKINGLLNNDVIWRVLKNGYPNKSISELGVETADDAYFATMQAINAILRGYTIDEARSLYSPGKFAINGENFEDVQRRGNKTLDLMFKLMDIGLNGKETRKDFLNISIKNSTQLIKENDNYYSQTFQVQSSAEIAEFRVEKLENLPEGSYISDEKGNKKENFKGNEKFKLHIPREKIVNDFNGKIFIKAKQKNYPIYFGASSIDGFQDYALSNNSYSETTASTEIDVKTDKSKLKIIKVDEETQEVIPGVKFEITHSDGTKEIRTTDKNGCIELVNQIPGTIYIKEIETVGKYELDSTERKINLKYDDIQEIKIENKLQKGNIKIIKIDKENKEVKLANVKFELKDEEGNIINEGITDKNGELYFNDLVIGKYTVIEKETNNEYELSKDEINVEVINGTTEELEIENKKIKLPEIPKVPEQPEKKETPKTPETTDVPKKEQKVSEKLEPVKEAKKELPKTGSDELKTKMPVSLIFIAIYNICLILIKILKKCL